MNASTNQKKGIAKQVFKLRCSILNVSTFNSRKPHLTVVNSLENRSAAKASGALSSMITPTNHLTNKTKRRATLLDINSKFTKLLNFIHDCFRFAYYNRYASIFDEILFRAEEMKLQMLVTFSGF